MEIQNHGFDLNNFEVPAFTLDKGEMVRFWVEVVPQSHTGINDYWVPEIMIELIHASYIGKEEIKICPIQVEKSLFDFIESFTLGVFLENEFELSSASAKEKLSFFGLEPDYKIKDLGFAQQKIFAIICEFQKSSIVSFDYYGLAPESEEQLTAYVNYEIEKGKSAISFNNLYYKPNAPDSLRIKNLDIRQKN